MLIDFFCVVVPFMFSFSCFFCEFFHVIKIRRYHETNNLHVNYTEVEKT